jgi:archaellum component FlaF (FlaF/FlaG flagellin family)
MGLGDLTEPLALIEGTHRVVIEGLNIEQFIADVTIRPNETHTINLMDVEMKSAHLRVLTNELDFNLIINGTEYPSDAPVLLPFGEYTVRVEKEGFIPVEQQVAVSRTYQEVTINMEKIVLQGRLIVYSDPVNCEVYVNGVFIGYSVVTHLLEPGEYTIVGRKQGYEPNTLNVTVLEGDNSYLLMLKESVDDPFANLPSMENLLNNPTPEPTPEPIPGF